MDKRPKEVVIVSAARTPIGKHGGYYNYLPAEDLAVLAVYEAIVRSGIDLAKIRIDQVIAGMIYIDSHEPADLPAEKCGGKGCGKVQR